MLAYTRSSEETNRFVESIIPGIMFYAPGAEEFPEGDPERSESLDPNFASLLIRWREDRPWWPVLDRQSSPTRFIGTAGHFGTGEMSCSRYQT